jgi:hypothetical protein
MPCHANLAGASAFKKPRQAILSQLVTQRSLGHPEALAGHLSRAAGGGQRLQYVFALDIPQVIGLSRPGCPVVALAAVRLDQLAQLSDRASAATTSCRASTSTTSPGRG